MLTKVPSLSSPQTRLFCESITTATSPCLVDSKPPLGAEQLDCFVTVEKQVSAHGGQRLIGWAIWEVPGVFIEAEFHAVWQKPDGSLLDLTPRPIFFPQILFLQDPSRSYEGRQVDNIRKALARDQFVIRYLFLLTRRFALLNKGSLADQHGEIKLSGAAAIEFQALETELDQVRRRVFKRYS